MWGSAAIGPLIASCAASLVCWSAESMADISMGAPPCGSWARQATAPHRATSTNVASGACLGMAANLTTTMFDVAVVGSGPAGATAARSLAGRGLKVALLEREALPRYKTCGGGLVARAFDILPPEVRGVVEHHCEIAELHLLDRDMHFRAVRTPAFISMTMRDRLDHTLATAAVASGAELRAPCQVTGLRPERAGIRLDTDRGV